MRRSLSLLLAPGLLLAATLTVPAVMAVGTTRYAAPTPKGAANCASPANACSLPTAMGGASDGDTVVLASGSGAYELGTTGLSSSKNDLTVRGNAGQARPVLNTAAAVGLELTGSTVTVSDLSIEHTNATGTALRLPAGSKVERVLARSTGIETCSLTGGGALWRSSACFNSHDGGYAFSDRTNDTGPLAPVHLRNLTLIATEVGSYGMSVGTQQGSTTLTFDVRNVIARGVGTDIAAADAQSTSTTTVNVSYSNYVTASAGVTAVGPNQTVSPVFADANYHQAGSSPTVNAGSADSFNGPTDLDGRARVQGSAIDIGAYEYPVPYVAPPSTTAAPDAYFTSTPKHKIHKRKPTFTFASTKAGSFLCKLDKKATQQCASPYRAKAKRLGKHKLTVTAVDANGLYDPTPAVFKWKLTKK